MSVELQKISGFLLFLVMKYVGGTAEDQWFSPVPCDEVCQWNCRRSVVFSCSNSKTKVHNLGTTKTLIKIRNIMVKQKNIALGQQKLS
jgi:hypothetical protein